MTCDLLATLTHPGEELNPSREGTYAFAKDSAAVYMVLPEEALQSVPSDDEDDAGDDSHEGHSHHVPFDPAKQAVLQQRRKQMEEGRKKLIKELYIRRHPHLFTLTPEVRCTPRNSRVPDS